MGAWPVIAQILAAVPSPGVAVAPQLAPSVVVQRYTAALARVKEPAVIAFDYTLDQTGMRTLAQTHRVFRSRNDERDETLTVDGKRLSPPKVRIFRGRRNRYAISALAPHPADYVLAYAGLRKNVRHFDYVFRLTPKTRRAFNVIEIVIDGVRFLPSSITFVTLQNAGSGSIAFGRNAAYWVPYGVSARATTGTSEAAEKLSFYTYRFPSSLPPSTFGRAVIKPVPNVSAKGLPGPAIRAVTPLTVPRASALKVRPNTNHF